MSLPLQCEKFTPHFSRGHADIAKFNILKTTEKIMIGIAERQGRKTLEFRDAELVFVGEAKTGISMRTGNEWKARQVNLRFGVGTNMEGKPETMSLTARCIGDVCDKIGMTAIGTHIHAFVQIGLNLHFKFPQTECTLVDFQL